MAEYIEREFLYNAMDGQDEEFSLIDALDMIDKIPAADVVEVVRCGPVSYTHLGGHVAVTAGDSPAPGQTVCI